MTLNELRYIVAVARERHFGRAATACFVSQPTLSIAVKKLEDALGVRLFERGGGEVSVTAAGAPLLAQAERVLAEVEQLARLARGQRDPLREPLRLGVIASVAPYLLPALIPRLNELAPGMPLAIEEQPAANLGARLRRGELDVALIALPFSEPGLRLLPVYDEPLVVVVAASHRWAGRDRLTRAEVSAEPLILPRSGDGLREQIARACPPDPRLATDPGGALPEGRSLDSLEYMVASGLGISVLPCAAASQPRLPAAMLRRIPFAGDPPTRRIALASRTSCSRQIAIALLARAVRACRLACLEMLEAEPERVTPPDAGAASDPEQSDASRTTNAGRNSQSPVTKRAAESGRR